MSEETTEPTPEPAQTKVKDHINLMINALELAKIAFSYNHKSGQILIDQGRKPAPPSPTLLTYIKKAEAALIKDRSKAIISEAGRLIEAELDAVRELLK